MDQKWLENDSICTERVPIPLTIQCGKYLHGLDLVLDTADEVELGSPPGAVSTQRLCIQHQGLGHAQGLVSVGPGTCFPRVPGVRPTSSRSHWLPCACCPVTRLSRGDAVLVWMHW